MVTIVTLMIAGNHSFCMQKNNHTALTTYTTKAKDPYRNLKFLLEMHITTTNGIKYNSISPKLQYETLKTCIIEDNMGGLSLYLEYKFNPNRYHKQLSLLHRAIKHCKPEAITILAQYNPDLTPLNEQGQTPLDYAVSLQCEDCTHAMATVISRKYNQLAMYNKHCGLTKHILNPGRCEECIAELKQQLLYYNLSHKGVLEEVITDLQS